MGIEGTRVVGEVVRLRVEVREVIRSVRPVLEVWCVLQLSQRVCLLLVDLLRRIHLRMGLRTGRWCQHYASAVIPENRKTNLIQLV